MEVGKIIRERKLKGKLGRGIESVRVLRTRTAYWVLRTGYCVMGTAYWVLRTGSGYCVRVPGYCVRVRVLEMGKN